MMGFYTLGDDNHDGDGDGDFDDHTRMRRYAAQG